LILNPTCGFVSSRPRDQRPNTFFPLHSPLTTRCATHTTQKHKSKKNIDTMIYPNPPAPSGFNFKGECDRRMSRDRARSPQHGDAIFYLHLLFFCMPLTDAHEDKRYVFLVNTCAFYLAVASNQRALTPAIRRYIFCRDPPSPRRVRGMVSDEGGGAPSPPWCR